jgi:hypothetical protein
MKIDQPFLFEDVDDAVAGYVNEGDVISKYTGHVRYLRVEKNWILFT